MNDWPRSLPPTVFQAIADPTRRRLLDLLLEGEASVNRLAAPFQMSRPAISQHLALLRRAGLVTEHRVGRERRYRLRPAPLYEVRDWLAHYEHFWHERLDALGAYLDAESAGPPPPAIAPPPALSPSSATVASPAARPARPARPA